MQGGNIFTGIDRMEVRLNVRTFTCLNVEMSNNFTGIGNIHRVRGIDDIIVPQKNKEEQLIFGGNFRLPDALLRRNFMTVCNYSPKDV